MFAGAAATDTRPVRVRPARQLRPASCVRAALAASGRDRAVGVAPSLSQGLALISIDLPSGLEREAATLRIGRALHRVAADLPRPGTLLVAGGETLRGLCLALGATSLELQGRILPGFPRSVMRGGVGTA